MKVSIGNFAFTIEEDGYNLAKRYLDDIKNHYYTNENGGEIVDDIEERMAELIMERVAADSVVPLSVIQEVISILGKPDDFGDTGATEQAKIKKRLYRDGTNKVLGGVCSGLAAYFNIDVVAIRIILATLLIILSSVGWFSLINIGHLYIPSTEFIVLAYIILWIIIPKAKTIEQRYAMHGEAMNLSNIQDSIRHGANRINKGVRDAGKEGSAALSGLGKSIVNIIGTILIIAAVTGMVLLSFLFLGVEIVHGVLPFEVLDYIKLGVENPIYLKLAMIASLVLPLVGMLYAGTHMLFGLKSPRWRPGLIIFLLWLTCSISLCALSAKASRPYWNNSRYSEEVIIDHNIDTLYIDMKAQGTIPDSKVFLKADRRKYNLFWVDGPKRDRSITVFPTIKIIRQNIETEARVVWRTRAFSNNYAEAYLKAEKSNPTFSLSDSLMVIKPKQYDRDRKWDLAHDHITLYLPENVKVIIREPIKHDFRGRVRWYWNYYWDY